MSINAEYLWLPVLAHMMLVVVLYLVLAGRKKRALQIGAVDEQRRALHDDAWPDAVLQVNNCLRNQFELPVLFYTLSVIAYSVVETRLIFFILAVAFVATRYAHAAVHIGGNVVTLRRRLFSIGAILVLAMIFLAAQQALTRLLV